jgi:predicted ArsR family transcriptional regulator
MIKPCACTLKIWRGRLAFYTQNFCVAGGRRLEQFGAVKEAYSMTADDLTLLERRKIEGNVLIPMVQAFQRAIGKERANEIAHEVILGFARAAGAHWAGQFGNDLNGLEEVVGVWAGGGSLEFAERKRSSDSLSFNVTRCGYAEFYKSLGLAELGFQFHCDRDFAVLEGFSPDVSLTRTQTIMEGATHCDFRFKERK